MEVHHHPHIEKKNFKEYFLEFLMIFLAVTLGFFAEGLRENTSNHHREKQYMQSMLDDLKSDTSMLMHGYQTAIFMAKGMDSLKTMLYNDPAILNIPELYRLQVTYSIIPGLTFDDRTSSQLKAGGMNLIKNPEVANAISNYWLNENILLKTVDNISAKLDHAYELRYAIFNFKYVNLNMRDTVSQLLGSHVDPHSRLMSFDPNLLSNYANHLNFVVLVLKKTYSTEILKQYKSANNLIALIQKEYNLK